MSEQDAVLHAFEEWWTLTGSKLIAKYPTAEPQAFIAGAEWQRERDAQVAESVRTEVHGDEPRWNDACNRVAREIRKGDA